ncbi:hypothetical protein [Actinokineospora enzanensis]|uniref:hypothetical protein n=1 Tax=Actinokineospora enzanensis TaxID=155975 RepID=UPI0012EB39DA|nr:hypothetical protein [Actinokineospora enzanensis]
MTSSVCGPVHGTTVIGSRLVFVARQDPGFSVAKTSALVASGPDRGAAGAGVQGCRVAGGTLVRVVGSGSATPGSAAAGSTAAGSAFRTDGVGLMVVVVELPATGVLLPPVGYSHATRATAAVTASRTKTTFLALWSAGRGATGAGSSGGVHVRHGMGLCCGVVW